MVLTKVTPEEMQGVPHYLIDVLAPEDEFHVVRFQEMAKEALQEIYEKKQIPDHCRRNRFLYPGIAV